MAGYREYRSVTEFPLHVDKLEREKLEAAYLDLRDSYRSLVLSRGQLVRRQTETKSNLAAMNEKLKHLTGTLEKVQQERLQLQKSLAHSVDVQKQLEGWGNALKQEVDALTDQMNITTKLLEDFEAVYEDVKDEGGVFSVWNRLQRLLSAAFKLLNTDIQSLVAQNREAAKLDADSQAWKRENPADINRSLLDE